MRMMTRDAGFGLVLLLSGTLAGSLASADSPRVWVAGWGETGEGGPAAQPFMPEGADPETPPPGFTTLGGRVMHILSQSGERDTATVAPIEPVEEPIECGPRVGFTKPLKITPAQLYLASTDPITVAEARDIPSSDPRLAKGIAAYLNSKGMAHPKMTIVRALEADLDGDGKPEAIVETITKGRGVAQFYEGEDEGDFSFVAVGAWSDAGFTVSAHAGFIHGVDIENIPAAQFGIQALPDFTGNGHFDLAVWQAGYEWSSIDVYAWSAGKLKRLAEAYCGV
jgi:hypothetical protein